MEDEEDCDDVDAAVALSLLATECMGCENINANDNARGESFSTAFLECLLTTEVELGYLVGARSCSWEF